MRIAESNRQWPSRTVVCRNAAQEGFSERRPLRRSDGQTFVSAEMPAASAKRTNSASESAPILWNILCR